VEERGGVRVQCKFDELRAKWAFQSYIGESGVDRGGFPFGKVVKLTQGDPRMCAVRLFVALEAVERARHHLFPANGRAGRGAVRLWTQGVA